MVVHVLACLPCLPLSTSPIACILSHFIACLPQKTHMPCAQCSACMFGAHSDMGSSDRQQKSKLEKQLASPLADRRAIAGDYEFISLSITSRGGCPCETQQLAS